MSEAWVILRERYGDETSAPTQGQLTRAVAELYHETLSGMLEGDYEEHGTAALRYGFDDGPMYVLEINRRGECRFEEWADQDFEQELAAPRFLHNVSEGQALRLWRWLARGEIDQLRSGPWQD